ncbi:MAG: PAS domain S-box protein [Betaproteobacteria bacterium]
MPLPENLAESILAQCADAVIYADRSGVIRFWNAASEHLFGFTADEALGQSLDLIIPERLRAAHWTGFDRAMAQGKTRLNGRPTLTKSLHKSGESIYVEMSFAVVGDGAEGPVGSVAIARLKEAPKRAS